jgi:hypothetical protein
VCDHSRLVLSNFSCETHVLMTGVKQIYEKVGIHVGCLLYYNWLAMKT